MGLDISSSGFSLVVVDMVGVSVISMVGIDIFIFN